MAETTTTTSWPDFLVSTIRRATRLTLSASATDEPPYFCTIVDTSAQPTDPPHTRFPRIPGDSLRFPRNRSDSVHFPRNPGETVRGGGGCGLVRAGPSTGGRRRRS